MPDPGLHPNYPYCGAGLAYVRTDGETHIYRCPRHGSLVLAPNGCVRQVPT